MPLRLYNTRTRTVEPFEPLVPGRAGIYVCGLTPSAEAHLGHARSFLFFDVLRRYLEHPRNGFAVTYVQNVTDVDDRSIAQAKAEGTTFDRIVARYNGAFRTSMRVLGVREPDREPYATRYVPEIVEMIGELIERRYAYASDDGVYYAVAAFPRYGELSGRNIDELLVGARIAENEHKADPLDFALWKFSKPGEPSWPSPWGDGRPGWHIECSAMARALLGNPFDIHGGGYDLIFPHHENEIAQSEPLMPAPPMANVWMHGGLLNYDGRKMSKSLGNFEPLTGLLERHDPLAIRLLFLQTGYRKPMNFTEDSIAGATAGLQKLQKAALRLREDAAAERPGDVDAATVTLLSAIGVAPEAVASAIGPAAEGDASSAHSGGLDAAVATFYGALDDDMDTAGAVGVLFRMLSDTPHWRGAGASAGVLAFVRDAAAVLGVGAAFGDAALDHFTAAAQVRDARHAQSQLVLDEAVLERIRAALSGVVPFDGATGEAVIRAVIDARARARKDKEFALGDRLRDVLAAEGIVLKDAKDGTTWTVAAA